MDKLISRTNILPPQLLKKRASLQGLHAFFFLELF